MGPQRESFELILTGPRGETLDDCYISSDEMIDGREVVCLSLTTEFGVNPSPGTYTLVIKGGFLATEILDQKSFTYSGPKIFIDNVKAIWKEGLNGYIWSCCLWRRFPSGRSAAAEPQMQ